MSNPFLGEIRMFAGSFAPRGFAFCQGQLLPISQNDALYALIGTTYGGDGQNTFGLPDLRGRVPINQGQGPGLTTRVLGEKAGTETVQLTTAHLPAHTHAMYATTAKGSQSVPAVNSMPAQPDGDNQSSTATFYVIPGANPLQPSTMAASTVAVSGGNQPHANIMPVLCVNFIIALEGVFPSRN